MSTSALKWTALVLMVLDHLGEFFPGQIPLWFRYPVSYTHLTLPTKA